MKNYRVFSFALGLAVFCLATAASAATITTVMTGLDQPRGLDFGPGKALYVAEAGHGGSGPCTATPLRGPFVQCYGPSGAVTRYWKGVQTRIVSGMPSYAPSTPAGSGADATGPSDVLVRGNNIYVSIGLGGGPDIRTLFNHDFGWVVRVDERDHTWSRFADIAGYEFSANPGGGALDSNPYALLFSAGGRLVVDAGGNSLLHVSNNGSSISTLGTFPSRAQGRSTDAVPNCVAVGPDGAYYVGELTGVPFSAGASRIYRVDPPNAPEVYLEGFTAIIDLAWGPDNKLYVLQHATGPGLSGPGALIRVRADGTKEMIASAGLTKPTSFVIADDEDESGMTFYVSNCGSCPGLAGHVVKIKE